MTRHKTSVPGVYFRLTSTGERRYQISYRDSNGKRVFKTVNGNAQDARHARNEILSRIRKGDRVVSSRLTMKELSEDYLRTQTSHLRPSTLQAYTYSLEHWVIPWFGKRKVSDVGVDDIADFIAEMRQTHSGGTIRTCITPLSRMFQYAVRRGWAAQNPVSALDRSERPKGSPRQMRILSTEEVKLLLAEVAPGRKIQWEMKGVELSHTFDGRFHALLLVAIFGGLRRGELLSLLWEDVDLLNREIHVRSSKTDAGVRVVAIPDFVVRELARLSSTEGAVFSFEKRNVNRMLAAAVERAGIPRLRFHDLRHTFASVLVAQGENGVYISEQMGHANPSTTYRVYAKLLDSQNSKEEARKKMDKTWAGVVA